MQNLIPHFIHEQFKKQCLQGSFSAATMFVDISGFTQLTESLMRQRKDGAEVLMEALEAIFSPLVHQVQARGGIIPLYAGDAFTAIFRAGDQVEALTEAARRALQAAFAIQHFLSPAGQERSFHTKYGSFALSVKVGLSAGPVHWAILEKDQKFTFYFRGPAVDACAQAQQWANPGEIVTDAAIRNLVGENTPTRPIPDTPFCQVLAGVPSESPLAPDPPPVPHQDLLHFVPPAVLDLAVKAEFREICPVFVSIQEPLDDPQLHDMVTTAMALAERYGGYLAQVAFGDKGGLLVLLFGAPVSYENNVQRAAEFLLALRQQRTVPWRAGITFGLAWAGIRGAAERSEYGAIGDTVNMAARLAAQANWGEIWASSTARERLKDAWQMDPLGTFQLKGKKDPVEVYRLVGKKEAGEAVLYSGPLVGREQELAQLAHWVQPILEGQFAGITWVYGEAGVGKSRLVHELRQQFLQQHDLSWFICPAEQILRQSLNPFKHFLRRHLDQAAALSMEENRARFDRRLDTLGTAPGTGGAEKIVHELERTRSFLGALLDLRWEGSPYEHLQPEFRLSNMMIGFKVLLQAESLRRPVILQVEDLHWLDADSQELLQMLTQNMEGFPLAILCTGRYRDDGSRVPLAIQETVPQHLLDLSTLPPEVLPHFAGQMLPGQIDDELSQFLLEKTGGNPFFVEQLVLDLRERGVLIARPQGDRPSVPDQDQAKAEAIIWSIDRRTAQVPTTINAVLVARLDRLEAQIKDIVQTAAVLGREFEVQVLSQMLRSDPSLPTKVERAKAERIWLPLSQMRYIFRHALMRDAAYGMQLQARQRRLHRLAAEAIEQVHAADLPAHYADLAYHYEQAEEWEPARRFARLAGEQAAAQFANAEALAQFDRALRLTPADDVNGRCDLIMSQEKILDLLGEREVQRAALDTLEGLMPGLEHPHMRIQLLLRQAHYAEITGDYAAAIAAARQVAALDQGQPTLDPKLAELLATGHLAWGRSLWRQGEYEPALRKIEQSLSLARAANLRRMEAEGQRMLGNLSFYQRDYTVAREHWEQALHIFRQIGDRLGEGLALNNLGIASRYQGDHVQARSYYEHSLQIKREIGDRRGEGQSLNNLGVVSSLLGEYAAARSYYEQSLIIRRETGDRQGESNALNNLGGIAENQGLYDTALHYYEQALDIYCHIGDRQGEAITRSNLGAVSRNLGAHTEAQAHYEQSLDIYRQIGDRQGEGEVLAYLGLLFHQLGDDERGQAHCQQALDIAQELGDRPLLGRAWTHLGHTLAGQGCLEQAAAAYDEGLSIRREMGQNHLVMETLAGLARVYLAQKRPAQAQPLLEEILAHLQAATLDGTDEPLRIYLTCVQVAQALQDSRAQDILDAAHQLLQARAAGIQDPKMRRSFLERIAAHQQIENAWEQDTENSQ